MKDNKLTQEIKRHAVIVAITAKHSDLEILQVLNVAWSLVFKDSPELGICGNMESVVKRRKHKPRSDTVRTPQFVQQVQDIIDEDPSKFISTISRNLQVSICTFRGIIHKDIRFKYNVMRRGPFMSAKILLLHIKPWRRKIGCSRSCMITYLQTYGHLAPQTLIF